ncbi:hypothetical protein AAMO2058_000834300 [Amorphochlora amoebiformis]
MADSKQPASVAGSQSSLPRIPTPSRGSDASIRKSSVVKLPAIDPITGEQNGMSGMVEVEWILNVIHEAHEKLLLLIQLNSDIIKTPNVAMDDPTKQILGDFFACTSDLQEAIEEEDEDEVEELSESVTIFARQIARLLFGANKTNPHLLKAVRKLRKPPNRSATEFLATISRLHELMRHKLKMTAEEEDTMHGQLEELFVQEKEDTEKFAVLKKQLDAGREEHNAIISERDLKIERLRREIKRIRDQSKKVLDNNRAKWKSEERIRLERFEKSRQQRLELIEKLKKQFDKKSDDNFTKEMKQHRIKYKKEEQLEVKIKKYDTEIFDLHSRFVELDAVHNDEVEELHKLEEHFKEQRLLAQEVELERIAHMQERNAALEKQRVRRDAAKLLQQLYLSWWIKNKKPTKKASGKEKKRR